MTPVYPKAKREAGTSCQCLSWDGSDRMTILSLHLPLKPASLTTSLGVSLPRPRCGLHQLLLYLWLRPQPAQGRAVHITPLYFTAPLHETGYAAGDNSQFKEGSHHVPTGHESTLQFQPRSSHAAALLLPLGHTCPSAFCPVYRATW